MQAGLQADASAGPARRFGPALLVAATLLVLGRAFPLGRAYFGKLAAGHSAAALAGAAIGAALAWGLLWLGLLRRPALVALVLMAFAAATAVLSGNAAAAAVAALLLAATLCAGDLLARGLRGVDAGPGDLSSSSAPPEPLAPAAKPSGRHTLHADQMPPRPQCKSTAGRSANRSWSVTGQPRVWTRIKSSRRFAFASQQSRDHGTGGGVRCELACVDPRCAGR
jgi:hypothetical protein